MLSLTYFAPNSYANSNIPSISRIDGANLYETSALISSTGWNRSETVIIARGDRFSDALAGVPLSSKYDAPLLLSRSNRLDPFTRQEIQRLRAKNVIILGGHLAIEDRVEKEIKQLGVNVERIAGANMFETAQLISERIAPNGSEKAIIVTSDRFEDALSIASYAGSEGIPILLTRRDSLPAQTVNALSDLQVDKTYVIGGELVISEKVYKKIPTKTERIHGATLFHTNIEIINRFNLRTDKTFVTTSNRFPDGLSGGALAVKQGATVVFVGNNIRSVTSNHLKNANYKDVFILGGELAINANVFRSLHSVLGVPQGPLAGRTIMLDPGHGGSDPGAIANGMVEKDLVLDISKRAQKLLEDAGAKVIMTRETDVFVSLPNRAQMANNSDAEIFISVHANSFNGTARGTETFWHGRHERTRSIRLANALQTSVVKNIGTNYRRVVEGNYHVIRETKIPSALLEVGFMDHAGDAAKLRQSKYRQLAAVGILEGVIQYFK